jgi:hypothetical protein
MPEPGTYIDFCHEPSIHWLAIATSFDRFDDEPEMMLSCMIAFRTPGAFGARNLDGMLVRSVASHAGTFWLVGKYGEVWTYPPGSKVPSKDQLPDAGVRTKRHLGPPKRIRAIAGVPYVCGYAGQVYTFSGNRWVHIDAGIAEPEGTVDSIQLEGLHGTGPDDIYVSGSGGLLARFDGRGWTRIPLPTKSFLGAVRAFSRSHVVAVGNDGVFVEWDGAAWSVTRVRGYEDTAFADVEMFNDELYIAYEGGLLVRRGSGWSVVETGLTEAPEFLRLTVGDGRLWAMGFKRVHSFDGQRWEAHVDPDNG